MDYLFKGKKFIYSIVFPYHNSLVHQTNHHDHYEMLKSVNIEFHNKNINHEKNFNRLVKISKDEINTSELKNIITVPEKDQYVIDLFIEKFTPTINSQVIMNPEVCFAA